LGPLGEPPLPFFSIREDSRHSRACSRTAEDCQQRQIIHRRFPLLTPLEEFVLDLGENVFDLGETIFAVRELVFGLRE
jgi:hypothetical protein